MTNENLEQKVKSLTGRQIVVRLGAIAVLGGAVVGLHYQTKATKPKEPTFIEWLAEGMGKSKPIHYVEPDGSHYYKTDTDYGAVEYIDRDDDGIQDESISSIDEKVLKARSCAKLKDYLSYSHGEEWGVRRELC